MDIVALTLISSRQKWWAGRDDAVSFWHLAPSLEDFSAEKKIGKLWVSTENWCHVAYNTPAASSWFILDTDSALLSSEGAGVLKESQSLAHFSWCSMRKWWTLAGSRAMVMVYSGSGSVEGEYPQHWWTKLIFRNFKTDERSAEEIYFLPDFPPNIHPRCGRGHPSPSPQPGRISQQLALDRSGRDTAELQPRTRVSEDQERRGPRLRRHQVVSRHGNSHDVVLVWSVISESVSRLIWWLIFSLSHSIRSRN